MKILYILSIFSSMLFSDQFYYIKVSEKEFNNIVHNRLEKNEIVEDIEIDKNTIKNIPFQKYRSSNGKEIAFFITEKNLKNFYDIVYENATWKCLKDHDLIEKIEYKEIK